MAVDRLRIVVIGLPELGHLLEVADPHGADVVTVPRGSDVGAVLADKARGATRDTLLFVVADCGDQGLAGLPDTLARAGFRGVVLTGLPGASGTCAPHDNLRALPAPFTANDVLAALSALPGDLPFFLPVAGGDRVFGEPPVAATGRRERNGILFPRRDRPGDDPLGPPVRVLPLDPLPSPPPPPPLPAQPADVTPIFATTPGDAPSAKPTAPPATRAEPAPATERSASDPSPTSLLAEPAAAPERLVSDPSPTSLLAQPVAAGGPEPSESDPPPSLVPPVAAGEPEPSQSDPPPAPVLPVAAGDPQPVASESPPWPESELPVIAAEPEPVVSESPQLPEPVLSGLAADPEPVVSESPLLPEPSQSDPPPAPVLPVAAGDPQPVASESSPWPEPGLPVIAAEPEPVVGESPPWPEPVLSGLAADREPVVSESPLLPEPVLPGAGAEPEVSQGAPPWPEPVLPGAAAEPDPEMSELPQPELGLPMAGAEPEASHGEPPPVRVLPVVAAAPGSVVGESPPLRPPVLPVAAAEPEALQGESPPAPVLPVPSAEPRSMASRPGPAESVLPVAAAVPDPEMNESPLPEPALPVAGTEPEALQGEPPPAPVPVASAEPGSVVGEPPPHAPVLPVAPPEPGWLQGESPPAPVVHVQRVAAPGPGPSPCVPPSESVPPAAAPPAAGTPQVVEGDGQEEVPGWAQLPAVPAGPAERVERTDGAWARSAPVAGALWVATPRLPAYQDEPVMPGARLPAPQSARGVRRGEVISVCSYKGGSGKCLTGDSVITDPVSGVPRRLDEVVRDPAAATVLTLDGMQVRAVPVAAKIDSGTKPTVRVEFASGRSVTVTPHHPFLLADGWRPAERIEVGEEAALAGRIPFPLEPRRLPAAEIAHLAAKLSDHGCRLPAPADADAAEAVYRLPEDQLGHLLALVWTADGTVGHDGIPSLELAAEASVRMVQHLLLRFGVQSGLTPAAGAQGWRLTVGPGDRATFARAIPLCGRQRDRLVARAAADPEPCREGDVAWDQVTAIEPAGTQQVWDLTVDDTHCFVANDIVVHNTTTAVLAAATLARAVRPGGKRVALVDANTAQSSVATILQRPARGSILDLVRTDVDEDMLALALTPIPEAGDLDVLFGAPDLRCADERLLTPTLWRRVVAALRRTHDYVIVDTPVAEAVGHELFDDFVLRDSSLLLVVLDPNRETIHNNVEWLDIIGDPVSAGGRNFPPDRVAIVLNRADPQLAWNEHSVGDHFRRYHYLGAIPHSTSVQQAADDARLTQRFDATVDQAVRHMLGALLHEPLLEADGADRATGSVLDRLLERLFRRGTRSECSPV